MSAYLSSQTSNCKNCYKCIRYCPVKSIRFSGNQAHIMEDQCILCGQCYVKCPQKAKVIRDDLAKVKQMVMDEERLVASLAPSFAAYYPGVSPAAVEAVLQKLGFLRAEETALGATVVKKQYEKMVAAGEQEVIITSCCHSINLLIQKKYPQVLPFLAGVISPMQAHAKLIKRQEPLVKVVFIGPCISKKAEADLVPDLVDAVITFAELDRWMAEAGLVFAPEAPANHPPQEEGRARIFPVAGGILRSMDKPEGEYTYISVDGTRACLAALEDIAQGKLTRCFVELSACAGSCIGGPVMLRQKNTPLQNHQAIDRFAGKTDFVVDALSPEQLDKKMNYLGTAGAVPDEKTLAEILSTMGKSAKEDELNCGTCGYSTCKNKAVAIFQGKANLTMCLPFLKDKAESFSDTIISNTPNGILVVNESFEVQQINESALEILGIQHKSHVMGESIVRILDPIPFVHVLDSKKNQYRKQVYLAEYGKYVDQTILYDESCHVLICIMHDVSKEEAAREKKEQISRNTIETANRVVEKQMRVVQEIASLLGETTAETKIALTRLKESFIDE